MSYEVEKNDSNEMEPLFHRAIAVRYVNIYVICCETSTIRFASIPDSLLNHF